MSAPTTAPLDAIDEFLGLARELTDLPDMATPQYAGAASDLQEISRKLLRANGNLAALLNGFRYFDFLAEDARSSFLQLVEDYENMKTSERFRELKYSCGDIRLIYDRHIAGSLTGWFARPEKRRDAAAVFARLGNADENMVAWLHEELTSTLDDFVATAAPLVRARKYDEAEAAQLQLNVRCTELSARLERFSSGLSDLVLKFAALAGQTVTLD